MGILNFWQRLFRKKHVEGTTVILDRDGTINIDTGYISNPGEIEMETGALEGMRLLHRHGADFVVFTNQSGIGRGYFESNDLLLIHNRIDSILAETDPNLIIERYFICPHAPDEKCRCRKPKQGLFKQFQKEFPEAKPLVMIGDKESDIVMLEKKGIPSILLRTGKGRDTESKIESGEIARPTNLVYIADNLLDAASFLISGGLAEQTKKPA